LSDYLSYHVLGVLPVRPRDLRLAVGHLPLRAVRPVGLRLQQHPAAQQALPHQAAIPRLHARRPRLLPPHQRPQRHRPTHRAAQQLLPARLPLARRQLRTVPHLRPRRPQVPGTHLRRAEGLPASYLCAEDCPRQHLLRLDPEGITTAVGYLNLPQRVADSGHLCSLRDAAVRQQPARDAGHGGWANGALGEDDVRAAVSEAERGAGLGDDGAAVLAAGGVLHAQHPQLQGAGLQALHLPDLPAVQHAGSRARSAGLRRHREHHLPRVLLPLPAAQPARHAAAPALLRVQPQRQPAAGRSGPRELPGIHQLHPRQPHPALLRPLQGRGRRRQQVHTVLRRLPRSQED
jgi:hypothetical protein